MHDPHQEGHCINCGQSCFFSCVNKEYDPSISNYKREIVFKKGETIFKQGTFLSKIIFIQEGLVKLFIEGSSGKDLILRFFGNQEYLGLTQVFGKNESHYTAEVLKKTRLCMIEINYFKKMLAANPALNENLFSIFNEEHDFLYTRLGVLGTKNLQGRLAEAILYLSGPRFNDYDIFSSITRKDIAELSGMSVESMIRLLNEFKHDRLINIAGKKIEINNVELLKILSRVG